MARCVPWSWIRPQPRGDRTLTWVTTEGPNAFAQVERMTRARLSRLRDDDGGGPRDRRSVNSAARPMTGRFRVFFSSPSLSFFFFSSSPRDGIGSAVGHPRTVRRRKKNNNNRKYRGDGFFTHAVGSAVRSSWKKNRQKQKNDAQCESGTRRAIEPIPSLRLRMKSEKNRARVLYYYYNYETRKPRPSDLSHKPAPISRSKRTNDIIYKIVYTILYIKYIYLYMFYLRIQ